MAIITEYFTTRSDGAVLNRTYSDAGYYIERDGVRYAEAVDPAESGRAYTETTVLIEEDTAGEITGDEFLQMIEGVL